MPYAFDLSKLADPLALRGEAVLLVFPARSNILRHRNSHLDCVIVFVSAHFISILAYLVRVFFIFLRVIGVVIVVAFQSVSSKLDPQTSKDNSQRQNSNSKPKPDVIITVLLRI